MKVKNLMTSTVATCTPEDTLEQAAKIMWEHDCGVVPVVDGGEELVAMITDRDICMSAYLQGRRLPDLQVREAMSRSVHACREDDEVSEAEELMRRAQVRRLPVIAAGGRLAGIISLVDLAREAARKGGKLDRGRVVEDLSAIGQPRAEVSAPEPAPVHA